jgi:hypothetical protein
MCERKNNGKPIKEAIIRQVTVNTTIFRNIRLIDVKCALAKPKNLFIMPTQQFQPFPLFFWYKNMIVAA